MMRNVSGKTVAEVEIGVTDPDYGADYRTVLVKFTDGTALRITGNSYEEVAQDADVIGPDELRAYARAAQGRREAERGQRIRQAIWDGMTQEEREAHDAARRARMTPMQRVIEDEMQQMVAEARVDWNRVFYGDTMVISVNKARRS